MTDITTIADIINKKIISQYGESNSLINFYRALASEGDIFSLAVEDVNKFRTLTFAEQKNLDILGLLVGQGREVIDTESLLFFGFDPDQQALSFTDLNDLSLGGRYRSADEPEIITRLLSDSEYRSVISAAIQHNLSRGTPNEIIQAVIFVLGLLGAVPDVRLQDGNTYFNVFIGRVLTPEEKAFLSNFSILPKPAGVNVGYIEYQDLNYFGFLSDPLAKGFGSLSDNFQVILSETINAGLFVTKTFQEIIVLGQPIAYWPLDEPLNTSTSVNLIGGPNADNFPLNLVILGSSPLKVNDVTTSIFYSDIGKSEISLSPSQPLNNLIEISIELIFLIDSLQSGTRRTLISHQLSSLVNDNDYWLYIENDNQIGFSSGNLSSALMPAIQQNVAHYLTLTRDNTGAVTLFLNGQLLSNLGAFPIFNTKGNIFIGNDLGTRTTPFLGLISDVVIHDKVINQATITQNYNASTGNRIVLERNYETVNVIRSPATLNENLTAIEAISITSGSVTGDYGDLVLASLPISYFRFGEKINVSTAFDEMGLQDFAFINSPVADIPGLIIGNSNSAVQLVQSSQHHLISIANRPEHSFTDGTQDLPFTFEAWIYIDALTDTTAIISKSGTNYIAENEYTFSVGVDGDLAMFLYDGVATNQHNWKTSTGLIADRVVYHVVATYAGAINTGKLYINGQPVNITYGFQNNYTRMKAYNRNVTIGAGFITDPGNPINYFNGVIDELAIYNREVTAAEILNRYQVGIAQHNYIEIIKQDHPIAYWRLSEKAGLVLTEEINGNNGQLINGPTLGVPGLIPNDINSAVLFDDSLKQRAQIADSSIFSFTDGVQDLPFSFEVTFSVTNLDKLHSIISKSDIPNQPNNEWVLYTLTSGELSLTVYPGSTAYNHTWSTPAQSISALTTYHAVITYNGAKNTGKIVLNGIDQTITYGENGTYTRMIDTNSPVNISGNFLNDPGFESFFNGVLQHLAIYDYEMKYTTALYHYNKSIELGPPETYNEYVMASSPVAYYRGNESTGTAGVDELGGVNAVHNSDVLVGDLALKANDTSLSMGYKSSTYLQKTIISPALNDPINISGDITIEFVFRFDTPEPFQDRTILSRVNAGNGFETDYRIYVSSDQAIAVRLPESGNGFNTPNTLVQNTVYHFAVTISATTMELFIDGALVTTGSIAAGPRVPSTELIYIGSDEQFLPLLGRISDIAWYNKILSTPEILQHANMALTGNVDGL